MDRSKRASLFQKTKQPNFCINCGHALSPLKTFSECPSCQAPIKRIRISTLRQVKSSQQSVDKNLQDLLKKRQEKTNKHIVESPRSQGISQTPTPQKQTTTPPTQEQSKKEEVKKEEAKKFITLEVPSSVTSPQPRRRASVGFKDEVFTPSGYQKVEKVEFEVVNRDEIDNTSDVIIDVIEEVEFSKEEQEQIQKEELETQKQNNNNNNSTSVKMGSASKRGKRKHNEDTHLNMCPLTEDPEKLYLFGVFDGHAGKKASQFCQKKLPKILLKQSSLGTDKKTALWNTFLSVDEKYLNEFEPDGCTACVGLLTSNLKLYVANAGDSRCIVSKGGQVIPMSTDHKPHEPEEKKRIEKAGHEVKLETLVSQGKRIQISRVDGIQSCSRSIGDSEFKDYEGEPEEQAVTCAPEIKIEQLSKGDFIVCACDGLWDVMSNEEVIKYVQGYLGHYELNQIAAALALHAIEIGSDDNVSCVIVTL